MFTFKVPGFIPMQFKYGNKFNLRFVSSRTAIENYFKNLGLLGYLKSLKT